MKLIKNTLIVLVFVSSLWAQDSSQTFLSLKNTGVEAFQKNHPEYDGRGTIILVLDTGVDMGVDGLTKTSTGEVKVIDIQDFTGQGDTPYFTAEIEEDNDTLFFVNEDKELKIAGANNLELKSVNDEYFIGVLKESLWLNSGSKAGDINSNGCKEDNFYFVTFNTEKDGENFWVVYLDLEADGDLSNDQPIRTYKENLDSFTIPNNNGLAKFTMGLNIFPEKKIVSFYFDDGSHGTHCAGISAGNRIGNNELFGVAPGASVIGLKLGNNNFSGGATVAESMKKAYLYADGISKEREEPCIINMSFGVGSEIEGQSDIEKFLEELAEENPYLYIATSNGNEGPGLSTSGMPSASSAIFSSGAVLSKEVGNDLYGTILDRDIILHFSSRGGEVSKPDVVAPGACVSTVPNFSRGDAFWGTSMASPYSAGVMSVILGAAKVEFPDLKIPSKVLYKVLRESATPMEGYTFVDQGNGLINIEGAYSLLKKYIANGEIKKFETYTTTSLAPNMPMNSAPNLYIRDASYLSADEPFTFKVKRNNFINSDKFYRIYNLKSNANWLKPVQKKVHIRNNQSVTINVNIEDSILATPGLYNATIEATRADNSKAHEFELMATIIVPLEFNTSNNYSHCFDHETILPGMHKRYFLKIPAGSSNLNVSVSSGKKEFTDIRYYLHDPDGRQKIYGKLNAKSDDDEKNTYINDLSAGVYEFVVLGQFTSDKESKYNLEFEVDGIDILGHAISDNKVTIINNFSKLKSYSVNGKILGFTKTSRVFMTGEKTHKITFRLNKGETKKTFELSLAKEAFNKVTDFALMIYNKDGKSVKNGGLSYKDGSITIKNASEEDFEEYTFVMVPGFAKAPSDFSFKLTEKTYLDDDNTITVKSNNKKSFKLYPDVEYTLDCDYILPEIKLPKTQNFFGELKFISNKTKDVEFTKIINIK